MAQFIEFGKGFWSAVGAIAGTPVTMKNLFTQLPKSAGVTPFRAFRFDKRVIVLVEPTHTDGAFVYSFETVEMFQNWKADYMHLDNMKNADI